MQKILHAVKIKNQHEWFAVVCKNAQGNPKG